LVFLGTLFGLAILLGLWLTKSPLAELKGIFSSTGRFESDFIQPYGFGASLINIGLNGLVATGYVLFVGGPLNGPTIGGILTVAGFGACGKHASNILPIFLGVILGGLTKVWSLNDPARCLRRSLARVSRPSPDTTGGPGAWPPGSSTPPSRSTAACCTAG
jgi:hypothetical protein